MGEHWDRHCSFHRQRGAHVTEPSDSRVAVYIDFDNIVISRYNQLHGRNAFQRDGIRDFDATDAAADAEIADRLAAATVDIGAILDFASSFGTMVVSRAYADWSVTVNAGYDRQLMAKAVDLTQLFTTTTRGTKNGADIRLAVDVVEDLFRLPDITHVIIVAGDSDYIALAQKGRRLGRYIVGIGVAGSTSTSLAAACDEFEDYDALPGVKVAQPSAPIEPEPAVVDVTAAPAKAPRRAKKRSAPEPVTELDPQALATDLLVRALQIGHARNDSEDWLHSASVKSQMRRMDPSFNEKALGFRSFSDFVKSRDDVADLDESTQVRKIRLKP
jgi:hypothetical protein